MAYSTVSLGPFGGPIPAINPIAIDPFFAADAQNVRLEYQDLYPRYGFRTLSSGGAPSGFTTCRGLYYLPSFDDSGNTIDEYLSFEVRSGALKPYSVNSTNGARTEITNGVTPLSFTSLLWQAHAFDVYAYCHEAVPNGRPVYRHRVGDNTSFRAVDTGPPTAITTLPVVSFTGFTALAAPLPAAWDYTGMGASDFSFVTGGASLNWPGPAAATASFLASGSVGSTTQSVTATMLASQDWEDYDYIEFSVEVTHSGSGSTYYPYSLKVQVTDAAGTKTMDCVVTAIGGSGSVITYRADFWSARTRSDWATSKKLTFTWDTFLAAGDDLTLEFGAVTVKGAGTAAPSSSGAKDVQFGHSMVDIDTDLESSVVASATYKMTPARNWFDSSGTYLGNTATVHYAAKASSPREKSRIYVKFSDDEVWRLLAERENVAGTIEVADDYETLHLLEARQNQLWSPIGNVVGACAYAGRMVWFKAGGRENVWHSRVGSAERIYHPDQDLDDELAPANFTMASDMSDQPVFGAQCGDWLVVVGQAAAYAQKGATPSTTTAFARLPHSVGTVSYRSVAEWRDENGLPGLAYVSRDYKSIWFVQVQDDFDGQDGYRSYELSATIRGWMLSFLTQTNTPDPLLLRMFNNPRDDSLWIVYGPRALVYRPKSEFNNTRYWEKYLYSGSGWLALAACERLGIRAVSTSGTVDELELNSESGFAPIEGASRDGGAAMPTDGTYWTSKQFFGQNRRVFNVEVLRGTLADTPKVKVVSTRTTTTKTYASGKRFVRFPATQQGSSHQYTVILPANPTGRITGLICTEFVPSGKKWNT